MMVKKFFISVLVGIFIGVGGILPGLSGSILAVALGYYEKILDSLANFFKDKRKNALFLLPIGIGAAIGLIGVAIILDKLMIKYETQVQYLFLGFVIGSLPSVYRQSGIKGNFKPLHLLPTLISFTGIVLLAALAIPSVPEAHGGFLQQFTGGLIIAIGFVIPGLSTSAILMMLGVYTDFMAAVSHFRILELIPAALGIALGFVLLVKIANYVFKRFRIWAYCAVAGFVLGTAVSLAMTIKPEPLAPCLIMAAAGIAGVLLMNIAERKTGVS